MVRALEGWAKVAVVVPREGRAAREVYTAARDDLATTEGEVGTMVAKQEDTQAAAQQEATEAWADLRVVGAA